MTLWVQNFFKNFSYCGVEMNYIKSENFLCFATLLEMIFCDIGIEEYTRFDIAENLGITLPPSAKGLVRNAAYSNYEYEWGIRIDSQKLNTFFHKSGINLHAEYILTTAYTMLDEEVKKWDHCYVIFLFSYGKLIGNFELQDVGHAALFIDMQNPQEIRIYDPGPKDCGKKKVSCYRMEEAMYQRRGGYVLIKKLSN